MAINMTFSERLISLAIFLRLFHILFLASTVGITIALHVNIIPCNPNECDGNIDPGPIWLVWIACGLDLLMVTLLLLSKRWPNKIKPRTTGIIQGITSALVLGLGAYFISVERAVAFCANPVDPNRASNACEMVGAAGVFMLLAYVCSLSAGLLRLWVSRRKRNEAEVRMDELQTERMAAARPPAYT